MTTIAEYRELANSSGLQDLDIGILCLNAGSHSPGPLDKVRDEWFEVTLRLNALHNVYLLKALAEKLLNRDKRCALLFTSSIVADMILPCNASYSAVKACVTNWGESMYFELRSNVDVTVWQPGVTKSNFHIDKSNPRSNSVPTDVAVSDILRYLGRERKTNGSFRHRFTYLRVLPASWLAPFIGKHFRDTFEANDRIQAENELKRNQD